MVALGTHLAAKFREAKMEAIRRAEEVSQWMRYNLANFLWPPACLAEADLFKVHFSLVFFRWRVGLVRILFAIIYACVWN